mgnify:FL=1
MPERALRRTFSGPSGPREDQKFKKQNARKGIKTRRYTRDEGLHHS